MKGENLTSQNFVNAQIRHSKPEDAEPITEEFKDEYVDYYGKFVDEPELRDFIDEMHNDLDRGEQPEEILRTVIDADSEEFIGVGSIKLNGDRAELGSTIIEPEMRGRKAETGNKIYDELFQNRLDTVRNMIEDPTEDITKAHTQLLADKSAATQNVADRYGFGVTGVYDSKFPTAYEGKGRVTVVDMYWGDSDFGEQEEVYVPSDGLNMVESALSNINEKRSHDRAPVTRETTTEGWETESRYSVKSKVVGEPMNFAEIEVVHDEYGSYTWDELLEEVESVENDIGDEEHDYWIGISVDANHPESIETVQSLKDRLGMDYAGFNPGKIEYGGEKKDSIELQDRWEERFEKQFIREAAQFLKTTGIEPEDSNLTTDYNNSVYLEI
ncbi:MAG: hypothetical protein ACI9LV_000165 [Candidatus Nanohaloarchaea archaeon]